MTPKEPQQSSNKALQTVGKDSFLSTENRKQQLQAKTAISLKSSSAPGLCKITPSAAFFEGTSLATALRHAPEETRIAVTTMVKKTVDFMNEKNTLESMEDILFTAEAIMSNNPSTTLEELRLVCDNMKLGKYGKFYGKLKTQEFITCLNQNEADRSALLEAKAREHENTPKQVNLEINTYKPTTMQDLRRKQMAPIFDIAKAIAENKQDP